MNDLRHPCENWAERVSLAAAGVLSPDERLEVDNHLATCGACRARLKQLAGLCGMLGEAALPDGEAETAAARRVVTAVAARQAETRPAGSRAVTTRVSISTRPLTIWRWIMRSRVSRAAAVAVVLAVVGVTLWLHSGGAAPALADFIRPILEGKSARCTMTVETGGPLSHTATSEMMWLDSTRVRTEMIALDGTKRITISDYGQGKTLSLNPATKRATLLTIANRPDNTTTKVKEPLAGLRSMLRTVRDNPKIPRKSLGEKQIDGRRVIGFLITTPQAEMSLWGDPKTGLPVRVEIAAGMDGTMKSTMSDFAFDVAMDESLFSLEPPADYQVEHQTVDGSPSKEKDLIEALRQYTKLSGGKFPDSLDMQVVTFVCWKKLNLQGLWANPALANATDEQRRRFAEQMDKIMDEILEKTLAGEPLEALQEKMGEMIRRITTPLIIQQLWENLALANWKPSDEQRRRFVARIDRALEGKPGEQQNRRLEEVTQQIMLDMLWEDLAPTAWKGNDERRGEFDKLIRKKIDGKLGEQQQRKIDEEIGRTLGERMLDNVKAWEKRMKKVAQALEENMRRAAERHQAESRQSIEAQKQVQRGVMWANSLPKATDVHYAGKGVSLGDLDTPIFWYRPIGTKPYRVIYADLSVRETDSPPGDNR